MTELIVWKTQQMDQLRREMDRLFRRIQKDFGLSPMTEFDPEISRVDFSETQGDLVARIELKGVAAEDLDITLTQHSLAFRVKQGEAIVEEGEPYRRVARKYGPVIRTLTLPCPVKVDGAKATYEKDVLTVMMSKRRPGMSRVVKIKVT